MPSAPADPTSTKPPPAAGDQLDLLDQLGERDDKPPTRERWAWLLAHIWVDPKTPQRERKPLLDRLMQVRLSADRADLAGGIS